MDSLDVKKRAIEAIAEKKGIVTEACNSIGLARSTFYQWMKDDPDFKDQIEDAQDIAIDYVEGKLFEKISGVQVATGKDNDDGEPVTYNLPPSDTAIIFYLKTKGKRRGYIERTETDHSGELSVKQITGMEVK